MFYIFWILYIFCYWNNENPPLYDILSPVGTLIMTIFYIRDGGAILPALSVILGTIADFMMDEDNMEIPLLFFSFSHIVRFFSCYHNQNNLFGFYSYISQIVLIYYFNNMAVYIIIFIMYQLPLYFESNRKMLVSVLFYTISDILIGYNMLFYMKYRKIRVLLVPTLYWLSELLYLSSNMDSYMS